MKHDFDCLISKYMFIVNLLFGDCQVHMRHAFDCLISKYMFIVDCSLVTGRYT